MTAHDPKRTRRASAVRRRRVAAVIGTAADADTCGQVGRAALRRRRACRRDRPVREFLV